MGKGDDDPYLLAFSYFSFELRAVKEVNRILSKTIKNYKNDNEVKMLKKLSTLPSPKQNEVLRVKAQFMDYLKSKKDSFNYHSGEEEIESLTN